MLQFVTGVDVRRDGLASADVGMRGYNQASNPHLMVLVNGRQVYMVDYGRIVWEAIPVQLDEIRQIEVIKGPNSALYGFNAVGGVINIITYDPLHDLVNPRRCAAARRTIWKAPSSAPDGSATPPACVCRRAASARAISRPGRWPATIATRGSRPTPANSAATCAGRSRRTSRRSPRPATADTRLADQEPPGVFGTERLLTSSIRAGVHADTALGVLSLSAYRSDARVGIDNINGGVPIDVGEYQTSYVVQASDLVKLGADHTLRFGLEYRADADDSGDWAAGASATAIYSASLMWDWQITPTVT